MADDYIDKKLTECSMQYAKEVFADHRPISMDEIYAALEELFDIQVQPEQRLTAADLRRRLYQR